MHTAVAHLELCVLAVSHHALREQEVGVTGPPDHSDDVRP